MKTDIHINKNYSGTSSFIGQIPDNFDTFEDIIRDKRNVVRHVTVEGIPMVIKYYKKITLANRFIYAHIRKSKGRRAYEHSMYLREHGIESPEPVAYINCIQNGLLKKCYYICLYSDYKPLKQLFSLPINEKSEAAMQAFARFSYKVHKAGIFHGDFSNENILYCFSDGEYKFALIDTNEMKIRRFTKRKGLKNMQKLNMPVEYLGIVASEYARAANADSIQVIYGMTFFKLRSQVLKTIKHGLKAIKNFLLCKYDA